MRVYTINPSTEEKIASYNTDSVASINRKVSRSKAAFEKWKYYTIKERTQILKNLSKILKSRKKKYAEIITTEMGKPIRESISEIEKCAWLCDYYRKNAKGFLEKEKVKTDAKKSYVTLEPLGVVACIMPWNFPFWQVMRFSVPALTAGNTVVLKHSSVCIGSSLELVELFSRAGYPTDVFQALIGSAPVGEALIKSKINAVSVTGSVSTGRRIAQLAMNDLKKVVLELGGSDPMIILADADLKKASKGAVKGRIVNNGQSCIAAKRFIVSKKVVGEFSKRILELTENLIVGDPMSPRTDIGPLVRREAQDKLDSQVSRSVAMGAKILYGGRKIPGKGFFYFPTILSDVKPSFPVVKEETFGPVAPIISVSTENEAIQVANDSEFGLGASIWTKNRKKGESLGRKIEAGMVYINNPVHSDPRMPFGGIKKSGIGRELSHYGIKEFVNIKSTKIF